MDGIEKDPKRSLTDAEKSELLEACRFQCQGGDCKDRDLRNKRFEFHHIKPHSIGGLTTRYQHLVLCVDCHAKMHGRKAVALDQEFGPVWDDLREWQRESLEVFKALDSERVFVLEAAPGAGKSMFAACAARYSIDHHPEINHVVCIAPWVPILSSMRRTFGRLRLDLKDKFHYDRKMGRFQRLPMQDVTLDTYAGFCNQTSIDVIKQWQDEFGFKFMLILDELHHTSRASGKWGPYSEKIAELATKVVAMSGTYFRSDNTAISFLRYDNEDRPITDYHISYTECVANRYVRQVAFRYHDPIIEMLNVESRGVTKRKLSRFAASSQKMMTAAKREVLDPNGQHVEHLIKEAWTELQAMRSKWLDAACLVVCRPGGGKDEHRAIHAVEAKIKTLTGVSPEVVVSDDAASRGRLEAFTNGTEPFLCAIRMVSEGVDIPRIRMVLFLTFTDSEMLFRQIVGRCVRYIPGKEDDTAAMVIMPKFPLMSDFANRFESEAKIGALKLEPEPSQSSGDGETPQVCGKCGMSPCSCFVVLDSQLNAGGGVIASELVDEEYVERAKIIRDSCGHHQHANVIQLADALQRSEAMKVAGIRQDSEDAKRLALKNIDRKVAILARYKYKGDYETAWRREIHERHGVSKAEISGTWRLEKINSLIENLKTQIMESL